VTQQANRPLCVLVVCTANQCRSPMAERLLARRLEQAGIDARVGSAGFLNGGAPAAAGAVAALRRLGLDLRDHRSRTIDAELLDAADVTITMEGTHVVDIATTWSGHGHRSITLSDAVDGLALAADQPIGDPESLRSWAEEVHRSATSSVFDQRRDVPDPMGRSRRAFRTTAGLLDERLGLLVDAWE
jgi:protein-tyrosine phosphatase